MQFSTDENLPLVTPRRAASLDGECTLRAILREKGENKAGDTELRSVKHAHIA